MRKAVSIAVVMVLVFSLFHFSYGEELETYTGMPAFRALYNNIDFADINNHWAKDSIYKMAALSVIRGMGEDKFGPDNILTREQALILLVRLMGLEAEAQTAAENSIENVDTGGYKVFTPFDYLLNGYIETALNNNIITDEEIDTIETLQEIEQENIDISIERSMIPYERDLALTETQLTNIENQLRDKITDSYTWRKPVNREQIALWVSRALGIQPINGQGQQKIYNLKDWEDIDTENLPIIEGILQKGIMEGNTRGYFLPKANLKRSEMAKLLDNVHEELLLRRGFKIITGIVERIDNVYEWDNGHEAIKRIFKVDNDDKSISNIIIRNSEDKTKESGFIGYKNGKLVLPEDIKEIDYIKYYVDPNGQVIYTEVLNNRTATIEGFIEELDTESGVLTIRGYDDKVFDVEVVPGANLRINNLGAKLEDFLYGQEVTLTINNGKAIGIEGYIDTGEEGYIHPGERIYIGKVLYVDEEDGKLTLLEHETQQEFFIDAYTPVIKNGANIGLNGISEGDVVRLEFDEYNGNTPIKVYVGEPDRQINKLYKATITNYNPNRDELILSNISYYENGKWVAQNNDIKIPLAYNPSIYLNGRKISNEYLNSYIGRESYIATNNNFGKEEAFKIVFKSGYEKKFYNTLQDIAFGDKKLTVDYNEIFFDDSTIIVKDGKLIHPYNLKEEDNLYVVSYGQEAQIAAFISVEGIEDTGFIICRGRIDEISRYSIELDDFDILQGTEWDYSSKQTEFNISEDTEIIDTRENDVKKVPVEEFTRSRFLKDDDRDNYYREYAYAVVYDDMILALNIIERGVEGQIISTGSVESIEQGSKIIIKDVRNWSDFEEKWTISDSNMKLDIKNAVVIKNGNMISINDIQENDRLYILRENDYGHIVIVR
jgi:hypothetical protein